MTSLTQVEDSLKLFNEKAEKLLRLSFVETISKTNTGVTLSWKVREDGLFDEFYERRGPNEEAIDAFVLTFRYFIQDNEVTSFRKMAELYANTSIDISFKNEFDQIRKEINRFLDSQPNFQIELDGKTFSRREIMEVFIYGGLSHANPAKKKIYDKWIGIPVFKTISENEFVYVVSNVLKAIGWIRNLNLRVLKELT